MKYTNPVGLNKPKGPSKTVSTKGAAKASKPLSDIEGYVRARLNTKVGKEATGNSALAAAMAKACGCL